MKKLTSILLTTLLLTACGWHLRGTIDLPANLNSIYVASNDSYSTLSRDLGKAITGNGIALAKSPKEADFTITLLDEREKRRAVSLGGNALAAEYEITVEADYRIERRDALALSQETARAARSYDYNRNEVLGKNEEENIIREELRGELIQHILRRLLFLASQPVTEPTTDGKTAP